MVIGGTIDGKYRILRLLGRGGMGAVYEAEDARTGQRVAVKVLHPRSPSDSDDDGHVGRFQREARAAAAIDTDHVARVLDWGTDPVRAAPYMVMEYLRGEDLHALLKRAGALRPEVALRIVAQACLGVQKAHDARVIHRDIKPANLFLARTGGGEVVVKILDFGIAKIRPEREGGETTGLTRTGGMLGSPIYMSPEQARGLKAIDYRTDIWSLGVVLYRALSGHTPHDETEALGDLIVAICSSVPRAVQELAPWVPAPMAAVANGALQILPDDRWPSAEAMLDALRPLLPDGWALREEMLVPVDDATRAVVARRGPDLLVTAGGRRASAAASIPPPPPPSVEGPRETSNDTVPASTATPPRRRAPWQARAAGAAMAAGVGAAGAYYAVAPPPGLTPAPALTAGAEAPGTARAPAIAPLAELPSVRLAVAPRDVTVEVDDAGVAVHDGAVEIRGALGSVHRVRLSHASQQTSADVHVTERGAVPAHLEIGAPHAAAPGQAGPRPAAATAATVPPARPAQAAPTKTLIPDRFE